jgi:hypothetical protein
MAKREIRVSIFYSDLFVWDLMRMKNNLDDFLRKSNEFYGKYRLRIDPFPFPYNYTLYKDAFVLSTVHGIMPDVNQDQLAADMRADTEKNHALGDELLDPNLTQDRRKQIALEFRDLDKMNKLRLWQGGNSNGEYSFRLALGERFRTNKMLKSRATEFKKAPRLVVIFCEFVALQIKSKTSRDVVGVFIDAMGRETIKFYTDNNKPIPTFTQPFVIIDIKEAIWHTLAHEIAHGNGHSHPTSSYGGYYDGPQESIYNYFSMGLAPSEVILEDADLKSLENAFFVKEVP